MLRHILYSIVLISICKYSSQLVIKLPIPTEDSLNARAKERPYVAAVVQYHPEILNKNENRSLAEKNAINYKKIIEIASQHKVDIIIFPELGITSLYLNKTRPHPFEAQIVDPDTSKNLNYELNPKKRKPFTARYELAYKEYRDYFSEHALLSPVQYAVPHPCNASAFYSKAMQILSCAALHHQMYVVANVYEREPCSFLHEHCVEYNLYSTNVVFDREGTLLRSHRKVNAYDEPWLQKPESETDQSTFETDFGVTFGLMNGIDIMTDSQLMKHIRSKKVQSVIMMTHRNDDVPFFGLGHDHAYFAHRHDIDLLVAGSSRDNGGGFYFSNWGRVQSRFDARDNGILISEIQNPRVTRKLGRIERRYLMKAEVPTHAPPMRPFSELASYIWSFWYLNDAYDRTFRSVYVPDLQGSLVMPVCTSGENKTCCEFTLDYEFDVALVDGNIDAKYYSYHMMAIRGTYLFDDNKLHSVEICAVVACKSKLVSDCGSEFDKHEKIIRPFKFTKMSVHRKLEERNRTNTFTAPIVVTNDNTNVIINRDYLYSEGPPKDEKNHYSHQLLSTSMHIDSLMIFGISSRHFNVEVPEFLIKQIIERESSTKKLDPLELSFYVFILHYFIDHPFFLFKVIIFVLTFVLGRAVRRVNLAENRAVQLKKERLERERNFLRNRNMNPENDISDDESEVNLNFDIVNRPYVDN